jgi:hypothetical protein
MGEEETGGGYVRGKEVRLWEGRKLGKRMEGTSVTMMGRRSTMDLIYGDACLPRSCWLHLARSCHATAATETLVSAIAEGQVERLVLYDGT